jgi:hypothetical protein
VSSFENERLPPSCLKATEKSVVKNSPRVGSNWLSRVSRVRVAPKRERRTARSGWSIGASRRLPMLKRRTSS